MPRSVSLASPPAFLLAVLLGAAAAAGFAPWGLWPLTLAGFAGLAGLLGRATGWRRAFALGWGFGLGHFVLGLNWIATAFTYQAAMPAWLGWVAVVLLSLYLAVFPALATLAARAIGRGDAAALGLALGATWVASEWLRATVFTGFAWNPVAAILTARIGTDVPAAGWLRLIGSYGTSGLIVAAAALIPALVAGARRRRAAAALGALALAAVPLAGGALLGRAAPSPSLQRMRIVQPNIGQDEKWDARHLARNYGRLAALTGPPGATPRLLLWPEAAVPDFIEQEDWARLRLARLLGPRDMLLLGATSLIADEAGMVVAAHNSLFALDARGRLPDRYDKAHLVPYGEYLPMRPLLSALGLSRLAPGELDFVPGPGPRTIDVPGYGAVGVQVCYEIIFAGHVIDEARRPRFLFNPSNDAWFGAWGPPQHLAQARLRAIEEGLPVVRATPTGISAVIQADGHVSAHLPWRTAGAIDAAIPAPMPPTPFARAGNLAALGFAVLLALAAFAVRRARR